jgi:hypothetical protein
MGCCSSVDSVSPVSTTRNGNENSYNPNANKTNNSVSEKVDDSSKNNSKNSKEKQDSQLQNEAYANSLRQAHVNAQSKSWKSENENETTNSWNYKRGFLATKSFDDEYLNR